jgi:hypothetical protein
MFRIIRVAASALLCILTQSALCQDSSTTAEVELSAARADWDSGNYQSARQKLETYVKKHESDVPPPYEAEIYLASSKCRASVLPDARLNGYRQLLQLKESLFQEMKRVEASQSQSSTTANLAALTRDELAYCKPVVMVTKSNPDWTGKSLPSGRAPGVIGRALPRQPGSGDLDVLPFTNKFQSTPNR